MEGDVIITCVGTIGRIGIVPERCRFSPDRNLAGCRPLPGLNERFLAHVLAAPLIQDRMRNASGSTAQPHVYLGDLRQLPVPVPPPDVQEAIAYELDARLNDAQKVDDTLRVAAEQSHFLCTALLHAAVSGDLGTQNRADESASALLDRVQKLQSSLPGRRKRARAVLVGE